MGNNRFPTLFFLVTSISYVILNFICRVLSSDYPMLHDTLDTQLFHPPHRVRHRPCHCFSVICHPIWWWHKNDFV